MRRHVRTRSSRTALLGAVCLLLGPLLPVTPALAGGVTTLEPGFDDQPVASVEQITDLEALPGGGALVTQKNGVVRRLSGGALEPAPVLDLRQGLCSTSERGLLSAVADPDFSTNGWFYVFRTVQAAGRCVQRVARFTLVAGVADRATEKVLLDGVPAWTSGQHAGGDMVFGAGGALYVTFGDGYCDYAGDSGCNLVNDAGRDTNSLVGKLVRIARDGSVPPDNPWTGPGSARCNAGGSAKGTRCAEVYASGLRSPFKIAASPDRKVLYVNDVGAGSWEEVDRVVPGADYGWNLREGPCLKGSYTDCSPDPQFRDPVSSYRHDTTGCAAITGGAFVPPAVQWPAAYAGGYLYSDFVCGKIFLLRPDGVVRTFATGLAQARPVAMAFVDGALLYGTFLGGEVRAIRYTGAAQRAPQAVVTASPAAAAAPMTTTLSGAGSYDLDGGALTYVWAFGDGSPGRETTGPKVQHTYRAGRWTATLRVRDPGGLLSAPAGVALLSGDAPPEPAVLRPAAGATFAVGQQFTLDGSATDPEDGTLAADRLSWDVVRVHASHEHPYLTDAPDLTGFRAPELESLSDWDNSWLALRLSATDSDGVTTTREQLLKPRIVEVTVATAPEGGAVFVNGAVADPTTFPAWAAGQLQLTAPDSRVVDGRTLRFTGWSDGGARTHSARPAADTTYTATYG